MAAFSLKILLNGSRGPLTFTILRLSSWFRLRTQGADEDTILALELLGPRPTVITDRMTEGPRLYSIRGFFMSEWNENERTVC